MSWTVGPWGYPAQAWPPGQRKEAAVAGGGTTAGRSVTARALAVLGAFDSSAPRLTLSEIAERSGTPLSTAHRLLGELTGWGALHRRPDGRYEIGRRLDRKSTRLNSSHANISYAVFCLKKKY